MRLETLGALAAFAAAVLAVEQRGNASTFGLVLSYALQLTMLTSMTVSELCPASGCCSLWRTPACLQLRGPVCWPSNAERPALCRMQCRHHLSASRASGKPGFSNVTCWVQVRLASIAENSFNAVGAHRRDRAYQ